VTVASFLYVLLMGYGFVFFTSEGIAISSRSFLAYVLLLFWLGFFVPIEAGTVFLSVWIVYVLCFVAAWKWRESFHKAFRELISNPFHGVFNNFLLILPLVSSMLLMAVTGMIELQASVGIPTGEPEFGNLPLQGIFLELAYAPVVEELGFRFIPIGLYAALYLLLAGRNTATKGGLLITAVLYPDGAKKAVGLPNVTEHGIWRGISVGEWVMIIVTSALYGYAHVMSGIGWQVGKITSVFVQGFIFAVAYIAYGFEAPILLHWYFNYYLFFFDPEVVSKFFPMVDPILSVVQVLIVLFGIFGWLAFAFMWLRKLLSRRMTAKQAVPLDPTTLTS